MVLIRGSLQPSRKPGSSCGDESGAAALEFGLVAPVFIMLVIGIMIYGIYLTSWIAVIEAASDAARASVAGLSTAERESLATAEWTNDIAAYAPLLSASNTTSPTYAVNGDLMTLTVSYNFSSLGFSTLSALLPIPTANPTISITVSNGGY